MAIKFCTPCVLLLKDKRTPTSVYDTPVILIIIELPFFFYLNNVLFSSIYDNDYIESHYNGLLKQYFLEANN